MRLVQVGASSILNLAGLVTAEYTRAADLGPAESPGLGDRVVLGFAGSSRALRGPEAAALWDELVRTCGGPIALDEWTPAAVRRADLAELAAIAAELRRIAGHADVSIGDTITLDGLARRLEVVRGSLAEAGEADDDDAAPAPGRTYRILDPDGRRSGPDGDALASAADLGALQACADRLAAAAPPRRYPIAVEGRPWGTLTTDGPGQYEVRATDGTVSIFPGAIIL